MTGLDKTIKNMITKLTIHLAETLNLEEEDIQAAIDSYGEPQSKSKVVASQTKAKVSTKPKPKASASASTKVVTCAYTYQKGDKNGTMCPSRGGHEVGGKMYCAAHAKSVSNKPAKSTTKAAPKTKLSS